MGTTTSYSSVTLECQQPHPPMTPGVCGILKVKMAYPIPSSFPIFLSLRLEPFPQTVTMDYVLDFFMEF